MQGKDNAKKGQCKSHRILSLRTRSKGQPKYFFHLSLQLSGIQRLSLTKGPGPEAGKTLMLCCLD